MGQCTTRIQTGKKSEQPHLVDVSTHKGTKDGEWLEHEHHAPVDQGCPLVGVVAAYVDAKAGQGTTADGEVAEPNGGSRIEVRHNKVNGHQQCPTTQSTPSCQERRCCYEDKDNGAEP